MHRNDTLKGQGLEYMIHGRGLLGTSTEAGHRDTADNDTSKPDMRTMGPGAKSLSGANAREGVRVDQRREHGSLFSPRVPHWY